MARLARLVVPGQVHLLSQRSHGGIPVFKEDADFQLYVQTLGPLAAAHRVAVHAYGLTPEQVLLLLTPQEDTALARMMQALGRRFGAAYNHRHGRTGALWEGRFRAAVVDAKVHLLDCIRFVEQAPAMPDASGEGAAWSSAAHHLGRKADPLITEHPLYWSLGNTPFDREMAYRTLYEIALPGECRKRMAKAVVGGWALGDANFVGAMEALTGRRLAPLPKGRPPKKSVPI